MAMVCTQCQAEVAEDAAVCPQCGVVVVSTASTTWTTGQSSGAFSTDDPTVTAYASGGAVPGGPTAGAPLPGSPPPPSTLPGGSVPPGTLPGGGSVPPGSPMRAGMPPAQLNMDRLTKSDRITGVATLVLFISLFLPWFGVNLGIGTATASGLTAHGYLYIVLILCLGVLGLLLLRAAFHTLPFALPGGHELLLLAATGINLLLVFIAFIFKPGGYGISGIGWSWGAFVGLIAAVVAVAPLGLPMIQARRAKPRA
jgi:hypothetical protein